MTWLALYAAGLD